ncbi:hypothetical protein RhiirA1_503962 [Rhizophagus irregularis]|uniref:Uncharacterized protein n=1 Tax=Rhizophagus irregularis TaxID=588596 RepID=A0A2N0QW54_9GLOM|nr:hypothetical protein RhiirA1_503962 [Rhizophagus irregularis]
MTTKEINIDSTITVQQGDRSKVKDEEEGWTIYYGKGRARGTYDRGSRVRGGIRGYRGKILDIKPADLPIHPVCVVTVGTATDVPDESLSSKDVNLLDKEIDEESNSEDINKSAEVLLSSPLKIFFFFTLHSLHNKFYWFKIMYYCIFT